MDKSDKWWVPYILLWRFLWVQVWRTKAHLAHPPDRCKIQWVGNAECGMRCVNFFTYFNINSAVKRKCETWSCIWPGSIRDAAAAISDSNRVTWTGGRWSFTAKWWSKLIQCFSCFKAFRLVNADIQERQERPARPSTRQNFKPGDWTCPVLNVEVLKAEGTNLKFRVWEVWYLF